MPDRRKNRGAHPRDAAAFAAVRLPTLRRAAGDLAWLLSRGYPKAASVELVGNRFALRQRQRQALQRSVAAAAEVAGRRSREVAAAEIRGEEVAVDGYNVLVTVEVAMSGGVVLACADGTYRDMASVTGGYRRVRQTRPALVAIGEALAELCCARAVWYFDRPVSNSGRLKGLVAALAEERGFPWEVHLVADPDRALAGGERIAVTADSAVLDRVDRWLNLARRVVEKRVPGAWVVDLSGPQGSSS